MDDQIARRAREISQRLAAATTVVVTQDGPESVHPYHDNTYSMWWTNVAGLIDLAHHWDQSDRFISKNVEPTNPSVPRPVSLVVMTAEAYVELEANVACGDVDQAALHGLILRLAVLTPSDALFPHDAGYRQLGSSLLQLQDATVYSRHDADRDVTADSVAAQLDESLRGDEAHERLRQQNYLNGLLSRIMRMQYEVDHYRLLAERAIQLEYKLRAELRAIKKTKRYKLAYLGTNPVKSVRRGTQAVKAKAPRGGQKKAIGS